MLVLGGAAFGLFTLTLFGLPNDPVLDTSRRSRTSRPYSLPAPDRSRWTPACTARRRTTATGNRNDADRSRLRRLTAGNRQLTTDN
ncbi:hypothetical protein BRD13_07075 [Halobacteriales archaeon SW_5_70_135]|nr:MAG: hypothetical protein BRD13_07075 [Halobacteriales archaeon SW_5_70_135]